MTKYVDFTWRVPVPSELLDGTVADKWIEEKDSADLEHEAFFRSVGLVISLIFIISSLMTVTNDYLPEWMSTGFSFTGRARAERET